MKPAQLRLSMDEADRNYNPSEPGFTGSYVNLHWTAHCQVALSIMDTDGQMWREVVMTVAPQQQKGQVPQFATASVPANGTFRVLLKDNCQRFITVEIVETAPESVNPLERAKFQWQLDQR